MKITTENDRQPLRNKNNYCIIIDHKNNLSQFIYNKYKTYKSCRQQIIDINKDLGDILKQYIKHYKLKKIIVYLDSVPNPKKDNPSLTSGDNQM